jgi:hypothetical protein
MKPAEAPCHGNIVLALGMSWRVILMAELEGG